MDEMDAAEVADASPSKGRGRDLAQKIAALRERQARLETHRKALQESGEAQLSLTAPGARGQITQVPGPEFYPLEWTPYGSRSNLEGRLVPGAGYLPVGRPLMLN